MERDNGDSAVVDGEKGAGLRGAADPAAENDGKARVIGHKRGREGNAEDALKASVGEGERCARTAEDAVVEQQLPAFVAASGFSGVKAGYVFRSGEQGVGYYLDETERAKIDAAKDVEHTSDEVTQQSVKQPRAAVDVDAALAKIAPALQSDKKLVKAAELLRQLISAEMAEENAHKFFDVMHSLLVLCSRDVHAASVRDTYARLVDEFYQKMLPFATAEQAYTITTWRCRCCTANLMYTDDSFQLAKACKQLSEALEGVQNDQHPSAVDRRLAVLEAMHAAFVLHDRAWARPSIEASFKMATDKRLCFEDESVDPEAIRQRLLEQQQQPQHTNLGGESESASTNDTMAIKREPESQATDEVDGVTAAAVAGTTSLRDQVDGFTSEIVARQRKRGTIGQQTVRTLNSTAHPLLTKRHGILR